MPMPKRGDERVKLDDLPDDILARIVREANPNQNLLSAHSIHQARCDGMISRQYSDVVDRIVSEDANDNQFLTSMLIVQRLHALNFDEFFRVKRVLLENGNISFLKMEADPVHNIELARKLTDDLSSEGSMDHVMMYKDPAVVLGILRQFGRICTWCHQLFLGGYEGEVWEDLCTFARHVAEQYTMPVNVLVMSLSMLICTIPHDYKKIAMEATRVLSLCGNLIKEISKLSVEKSCVRFVRVLLERDVFTTLWWLLVEEWKDYDEQRTCCFAAMLSYLCKLPSDLFQCIENTSYRAQYCVHDFTNLCKLEARCRGITAYQIGVIIDRCLQFSTEDGRFADFYYAQNIQHNLKSVSLSRANMIGERCKKEPIRSFIQRDCMDQAYKESAKLIVHSTDNLCSQPMSYFHDHIDSLIVESDEENKMLSVFLFPEEGDEHMNNSPFYETWASELERNNTAIYQNFEREFHHYYVLKRTGTSSWFSAEIEKMRLKTQTDVQTMKKYPQNKSIQNLGLYRIAIFLLVYPLAETQQTAQTIIGNLGVVEMLGAEFKRQNEKGGVLLCNLVDLDTHSKFQPRIFKYVLLNALLDGNKQNQHRFMKVFHSSRKCIWTEILKTNILRQINVHNYGTYGPDYGDDNPINMDISKLLCVHK